MSQVLDHLPLEMQTGKLTVAGVVVKEMEVSTTPEIMMNGNEVMFEDEMIYDTISVADEGCTEPSSNQQAMTVKVFHGDGINYPHGTILRKGDVLILKDMMVSVCVRV